MDNSAIVYLEDIETSTQKKSKKDAQPTTSPHGSQTSAPVTGKRQRSLVDMFPGSQITTVSSKRPRTSQPSASSQPGSGQRAVMSSNTSLELKLNAIPFSLSEFQANLSEEEQRLLSLECATMGKIWLKVLAEELKKRYFLDLKRFLWDQGVQHAEYLPRPLKVYPSPKDIYSWSNTPLGRVKVVILGQDPYHGVAQAHGLSFSVPKGTAVPPSLRSIYTELKAEYPEFEPPRHGNLTKWAANGVLLLNTALTVKPGEAGSHSNRGWETFTDKVVQVVDKYGGANLPKTTNGAESGFGRGVVFLAWGRWAAERVGKLSKTKHLILTSAHPSPLSAHKGFFGNGHFVKANEWLETRYGPEGRVDWCSL